MSPKKIEFNNGETVVYPKHGVGEITKIESMEIASIKTMFYVVKMEQSKLTIRVPIEKQEEVGLRGAEMITQRLNPDIAIVTDVCHDTTTPMINKKEEGLTKIGDGPVISYAPAVHNIIREKIVDTAEKNKIPFQRLASSRVTGTDTDAFAYSNGGIPSALISLPLRYMHTTVEMVQKEDVENVIRLIYKSLQKIKNNHDFMYLK